jgi:hypothetical protein
MRIGDIQLLCLPWPQIVNTGLPTVFVTLRLYHKKVKELLLLDVKIEGAGPHAHAARLLLHGVPADADGLAAHATLKRYG